MEERGRTNRITQRRLGDAAEDPSPEEIGSPPDPPQRAALVPAEPVAPDPDVTRGPSDLELRKRQRVWRLERARFERARPQTNDVSESPP